MRRRYTEDFSAVYISADGKLLVVRGAEHDYVFELPPKMLKSMNSEFRDRIHATFSDFSVDAKNMVSGSAWLNLDARGLSPEETCAADRLGLIERSPILGYQGGVVSPPERGFDLKGQRYARSDASSASTRNEGRQLNQAYRVALYEPVEVSAPPVSPVRSEGPSIGAVIAVGLLLIVLFPMFPNRNRYAGAHYPRTDCK